MTSRGLTNRNHPRRDLLGSGNRNRPLAAPIPFFAGKPRERLQGQMWWCLVCRLISPRRFAPAPDLGLRRFERQVFSWQNCCPMPIPSISTLLMSLQLLIGAMWNLCRVTRSSGRRH